MNSTECLNNRLHGKPVDRIPNFDIMKDDVRLIDLPPGGAGRRMTDRLEAIRLFRRQPACPKRGTLETKTQPTHIEGGFRPC